MVPSVGLSDSSPAPAAGARPWNIHPTCRRVSVVSAGDAQRTDGLLDRRPVNPTGVGCDTCSHVRPRQHETPGDGGGGAAQLSLLEGLAAGHVKAVEPVLISARRRLRPRRHAARMARGPARRSGDVHRPCGASPSGPAAATSRRTSGASMPAAGPSNSATAARRAWEALSLCAQLDSLRRARPGAAEFTVPIRPMARAREIIPAIERAQKAFDQREIRIAVHRCRRSRLRDRLRAAGPAPARRHLGHDHAGGWRTAPPARLPPGGEVAGGAGAPAAQHRLGARRPGGRPVAPRIAAQLRRDHSRRRRHLDHRPRAGGRTHRFGPGAG